MNDERDPRLDEPIVGLARNTYRDSMAPGSVACPDDETLAGLVLGDATDADRPALADHVTTCARCTASVKVLMALHRDASARARSAAANEPQAARPASPRPPTRSRGVPTRLALPLAALLALALGWTFLGPATTVDAPSRDGHDRSTAERSKPPAGATTPAHGARLRTPPDALSWTAEPPATAGERARVRLFDADGEPLWDSGPVDATTIALPDAVRDVLVAGSYFWVVEPAFATGVGDERGPYWFEIGE